MNNHHGPALISCQLLNLSGQYVQNVYSYVLEKKVQPRGTISKTPSNGNVPIPRMLVLDQHIKHRKKQILLVTTEYQVRGQQKWNLSKGNCNH